MYIADYSLMFSFSRIIHLLSFYYNWTYNTMAFIRSRFSRQNHGKSIHLKSTWLSSSRLKKRMSFIISLTETNRSGILFLLQKNNAFCSSPYAMARSFLLVESSFLSKKDNRTFNEPWRCRYSASSFRASGEVSSPYSYYITVLSHIGHLFRLYASSFQRQSRIFF